MRLSGPALVLALALAGCGNPAAEPTANNAARQATAAPARKGSDDAYAACRDRAAGAAAGLIACADAAVAAAGQAIDSREAATAFRAALRQLGDQTIQFGGEAARVTFAHAAVHVAQQRAALLSGDARGMPTTAAPASITAAWAESRAISCLEHPVQHCAERYDALLPALVSPQVVQAATAGTSPGQGLPLPSCEDLQADGEVGSALVDAFYTRYPKALASSDSVEAVALDPAALDNVVRYLVCVAGATGYDPTIAENGLALFASKRHGSAARGSLAALARGQDPAAGAARRFQAQIAGYLQGAR
ncbi:hypothetical protein [Sphingomonas sp. TDK1]|uniref:hypothetical protein n=1 Tax=Sphingomonas sp. TDK1 TaxID=453247 RepID=UPI0007DA20A6|nr:hypothetical protein [Sphingomonas sp. TDK1]OAN57143.1 hypothetical protein A7X12_07915 [Sphingomonas sp. TDK1]